MAPWPFSLFQPKSFIALRTQPKPTSWEINSLKVTGKVTRLPPIKHCHPEGFWPLLPARSTPPTPLPPEPRCRSVLKRWAQTALTSKNGKAEGARRDSWEGQLYPLWKGRMNCLIDYFIETNYSQNMPRPSKIIPESGPIPVVFQ